MPRTNMGLTEETKFKNEVTRLIAGYMKVQELTHEDMAAVIGKSRPRFTTQLNEGQFSSWELKEIFKKLKPEDREIINLFNQ